MSTRYSSRILNDLTQLRVCISQSLKGVVFSSSEYVIEWGGTNPCTRPGPGELGRVQLRYAGLSLSMACLTVDSPQTSCIVVVVEFYIGVVLEGVLFLFGAIVCVLCCCLWGFHILCGGQLIGLSRSRRSWHVAIYSC